MKKQKEINLFLVKNRKTGKFVGCAFREDVTPKMWFGKRNFHLALQNAKFIDKFLFKSCWERDYDVYCYKMNENSEIILENIIWLSEYVKNKKR